MRYREGYLKVITGCMFSGKTEQLIREINVLSYAKKKVAIFNHSADTRYSDSAKISSHNGNSIDFGGAANSGFEVAKLLGDDYDKIDYLIVDEVQFFSMDIIDLIEELLLQGVNVVVAGLDQDFRGEPFPVMSSLMAKAEEVVKLHAICEVCGSKANMSQRLVDGEPAYYYSPTIVVGSDESYEARCRHCHEVL